jgi:hypothetical protein
LSPLQGTGHGFVSSLKRLGIAITGFPALTCWATIIAPYGLCDSKHQRATTATEPEAPEEK